MVESYMGLLRRIKRHNLSEALRLVPVNMFYLFRYYSPRRMRARRHENAFDRRFGLDTTAPMPVGALGVDDRSESHASPYAAVGIPLLRSMLSALPIEDFTEFSFIDYGSGKGRALLIASEFGFSSVIGVEFSILLHQVAQKNLRKFEAQSQRQINFILVNENAAEYSPPYGKKVVFFFNPFDREIMNQALCRLRDPVRPAELFVIYVNPRNRDLFKNNEWTIILNAPGAVLYRRLTSGSIHCSRTAP
jgi:SAM-dependent methyltransferase